jgi:protein gp37
MRIAHNNHRVIIMSEKTGINWTEATWNPIAGCSRVSEGCRHCYAEREAANRLRTSEAIGVLMLCGSVCGRKNDRPMKLIS